MIKPGTVSCAGLVAVMLVLPTSMWKKRSAGASVRVSSPQSGIQESGGANNLDKTRD